MNNSRMITLYAAPVFAMTSVVGATEYEVFQVPPVPGWTITLPTSANDNGHIVGVNTDGFWFMPKGFYYDGKTNQEFGQDLKDQQPYEDWAMGIRPLVINNNNHILLLLEVLDVGGFGYIWDGTDYSPVDPTIPPGDWDVAGASATAMNNLGQVAGAISYQTMNPAQIWSHGFIWDPATDALTIVEPPAPYDSLGITDINDHGAATGFAFGGPEPARGFIWNNGEFTWFTGIDEDDYLSICRVINNNGKVAAFSTNLPEPGTPSLSRLFLWSEKGIHGWTYPLGNLTGFTVFDMNENDEIVGTMLGPQQAFHYRNGKLRNLNDLVASPIEGTTLDLWDAASIDHQGRIVAQGQYLGTGDWNNYAFILTPKPGDIVGDLNGDGVVNVSDMLILLGAWGDCPDDDDCAADLNGDGIVNVSDLLILLANWG